VASAPNRIRDSKCDWTAAEQDFRAGVLTLREIGARHGVSHTAVSKRAKLNRWTRDLAARVRVRADEKFAVACSALAPASGFPRSVSKISRLLAESTVESYADAIVRVRLEHKASIARAARLYDNLIETLQARIALRAKPYSDGASPTTLAEDIKMLRELAMCLSEIVEVERKAFHLDQAPQTDEVSRKSLPIRFVEPSPCAETQD
jgi:hypothetical protein